jgi:signal transduction histidine kinase
MLEEVERSCARISGLLLEVKELRKLLSNEISLARETFDFAALVEELASGMHEGRDRGVSLELRGNGRGFEVVGDRKHLGEAVGALFRASLRERGLPGVVVVELSRLDGPPPAALLTIGDEPFRRALRAAPDAEFDGWRGGLGMVLPIAQRVVEAHGGVLFSAPDTTRPQERAGWSGGSALRIPLKG